MFVNRRTVHIEWGDCDAAGIVFYPRYFDMFDHSTMMLFEAVGYKKHDVLRNYDFRGWPMVDTRARFIIPSTFGDDLVIATQVVEFGRTSFKVEHKGYRGDELALEGWETRVWTGNHPDDPKKLKARPMPDEIKAALSRSNV